ncbi:antibiotic biosynthesis monooxygenase [Paenibacillus sp. MMS20-IR301]|uniref:antibiotic biosynthesis monooxygenase n=1 Tax=Paenibacillus sp. MMS20-IR301 TaxID=2895946 RepID=UPI0028E38B08|nr:antibiotic biosynthesis monooxygenase [Paenibacillus sp. MMS20-IR301]WNS45620.1 antibiotic biosynthesis monooxygenase [Paenibacillus sp. MMS20-IR301]
MYIQTRSIIVEQGNSATVVERFSKPGAIEEMDGLIDLSVMVNKKAKDQEEVLILIRWESEEAWKNWEKSDAHVQGHKNSRGQEKPAYILSTTVNMYQVQTVKEGKAYGQRP